jgi:hypothetical protein
MRLGIRIGPGPGLRPTRFRYGPGVLFDVRLVFFPAM